MRNKFQGICYRCAQIVENGTGHFERHQGTWRVQHAQCAIDSKEKSSGSAYGAGENKPIEAFRYLNEIVEHRLMPALVNKDKSK